MYKEKLLAYYKANPLEAILIMIALGLIIIVIITGLVFTIKESRSQPAAQVFPPAAEEPVLFATNSVLPPADTTELSAMQPTNLVSAEEVPVVTPEVTGPVPQPVVEPPVVVPEKIPAVVAKSAVKVTPKTTVDNSGLNCVRFPADVNAMLRAKNPGPAPDGASYKGKMVCHVIADGKKDNPHKSSANNKGKKHNGGLCLDPDERPMPPNDGGNCYPAAVYGKILNKYLAKPW
ncbi:hypothetical protein COV88_01545 [Candidatus Saccharibacteria bacterium CG11_big_fil_rev_8_21_14_0_20_41_19]|nr:hypothetical protein [Candidatus Saccharibacteria bacterium]OIP86365.1 MAG: hypothetical protein AUK57_01185 [Candidatus Saccharibacteria bacterium CG2_30_41_52]PIQ71148.1 MAG: hypothetical protein COV88_01545 [Candidatus Saccharibacteria bacterium CG11_big_fil_rev_8_21_14_0_20_41_19]PIZ59964.1 MAG: hypothetical protein COY18_02305 [Candidatus Saccharibacteria bacterium CG_4_10_14_0_2_um_filter_41_11]PJC29519.1 MAG: hypothetical protein CO052_02940 [Candidatus Saccharibacteria bacterium CG_4